MIIGTGIDIVDMRRIQKLWDKHGLRFLNKVYTPYEQAYCLRKNQAPASLRHETSTAANSLAKVFAAKEATLKAIGNTNGIDWLDMEVQHEPTGRPFVTLHRQAHENLQETAQQLLGNMAKTPYINYKAFLSLSDEPPYAIASVVISFFNQPLPAHSQ